MPSQSFSNGQTLGQFFKQLYKGMCKGGIVADPNSHETGKAQEGSDVREVLVRWPIANACNL